MKMEILNEEDLRKEVETEVKPTDSQLALIEKQVESNVKEIMDLDLSSLQEKKEILQTVDKFGMDSLTTSARKNSLLKVTVGNLSKSGEEGSEVSKSLADLHREIKDLDPSMLDFTKEGALGKIFNPIRRYFDKYKKSDDVINGIMESLERGKSTLTNDNTTLEIEEENLREVTKKLKTEIELGVLMDSQIVQAIEKAKLNNEDEEKIKFVTEEILYPLRQRIMDMQQMIVVNQQGIVAMEVVKRNNKELIRGVDRAKTVTITALRTAVMVASALYSQKIVLTKIEKLNEATENIIASTGNMLKEQGTAIQKQATESTVSPEVLKQAFQDAITALEDISTFKQEALPRMAETVLKFKELAETGEKEIARLELAKADNGEIARLTKGEE